MTASLKQLSILARTTMQVFAQTKQT